MKVAPSDSAVEPSSSREPTGGAPVAGVGVGEAGEREPWGWNRRQRLALGALVGMLLLILGVELMGRPFRLQDGGVVIDGAKIALPDRVDPNTATLRELSLIPHIGEALGQKIIDYREAHRAAAADGIVFHEPSDLDSVPTIGKKLLEQLAPYLRFPGDSPQN